MTDDELSDEENVIRYVRPGCIDEKGEIHGHAFKLRASDINGLSANWPDAFEPPRENQLEEIRSRFRLERSVNGKFVELNIGRVKNISIKQQKCSLQFFLDPLPESDEHMCDPSHVLVKGIPYQEGDSVHPVCEIFVECIIKSYRAK